jgi:PIF1-like helicase
MTLHTNMRTGDELDFAQWLKQVGENTLPSPRGMRHGFIPLDPSWMVNSIFELISSIFGENPSQSGANRAIVAWTNKDVNMINTLILEELEGHTMEFPSEDSVVEDFHTPTNPSVLLPDQPNPNYLNPNTEWLCGQVTVDQLNLLHPPGAPPHLLKLKTGAILMVIRNLDVQRGICNGTRVRLISASRQVFLLSICCSPTFVIPAAADVPRG